MFLYSLLSVNHLSGGGGGKKDEPFSSKTTTTTPQEEPAQALRARGVFAAEQIAKRAPAALILAWCRWWDQQPGVASGVLVDGIRSGNQPPALAASAQTLQERQTAYGESVREWVRRKLPDLCGVAARVVEAHRAAFGDELADRLAGDGSPHPAAVAMVMRLHQSSGRLTVKEHGREIRGAVREWDERAVADCEAIAGCRVAAVAAEEV